MFVNKLFTYPRAHISKSKRCFIMKSSTYYFHMKTKILTHFQICISVPFSNTEAELKKTLLIKKMCILIENEYSSD